LWVQHQLFSTLIKVKRLVDIWDELKNYWATGGFLDDFEDFTRNCL